MIKIIIYFCMDGGDIINKDSRYIPVIGVIVIFAFLAIFCVSPFGTSVFNTQNNIENSNLDSVTASAATVHINKNTKNLATTKSNVTTNNDTKIIKKVIKVTKMPLKDYKAMESYIKKYKKLKGKEPSYYTWKSEDMIISKSSYRDAIKRYNKWVKTNKGTPPNYVNIFKGVKYIRESETTPNATNNTANKNANLPLAGLLKGYEGLSKLQTYMNINFNHQAGGPFTFEGVVKSKGGDCWGLAEWAAQQLKANNYEVRIVQGASSSASNHRWVQVKLDGKWIDFESSLVTKKYGSKHYSTTCAKVSQIIRYL